MIIDFRERALIEKLSKDTVEFEVKSLPVGDIIIGKWCFERKEIGDLAGSLMHRIWEQLANMKANFENACVIIEGDYANYKNYYAKKQKFLSKNMVLGFIAKCLSKYEVSVIATKNLDETAKFLKLFEEKLNKPMDIKKEVIRIKKGYHDVYLEMLATIPSVGYEKAKLILQSYNFKDIITLSKEDLMKIDGVGEKIATNIKKWL